MSHTPLDPLGETARRLAGAESVLVLTGAGISAESGIPTFRGREGLWKNHDPMELASPEGFARDPALVWEWYAWRIGLVQAARPNPGHEALARLEKATPRFLLLTQNVDGLHRRAGSENLHEIHGSILRARCTETDRIYPIEDLDLEKIPVRTPEGTLARPDVVWFGETIRMDAYGAVEAFLADQPPDVCLVIGTSGLFAYIQGWVLRARRAGAFVADVNTDPSPLAQVCQAVIRQPAGEALPRLIP
ncbi:MAG: NAD-dependent deacylase [Sumerlaeia bacterium]